MEQINIEGLGAVQETLIIPLAMRALDLKSKKPILGDKYAAELYERVAYDKEKFAPRRPRATTDASSGLATSTRSSSAMPDSSTPRVPPS